MPIELHEECKARIIDLLREGLPKVAAKNGMFIERASTLGLAVADLALPQTGKLRDRLIDYVGEFPFANFVTETLGLELWELDKYQSEVDTVKLIEIPGYEDPNLVALRLLQQFQTLPWNYKLSFQLPQQLSTLLPENVEEFALSPAMKMVRATGAFEAQFPLVTDHQKRQERVRGGGGLLSLLSTEPPIHTRGVLYLQIDAEGFIGQYGGSAPAAIAERTIRAFCGLGIALRLFKHQPKFTLHGGLKSFFYVHKRNNGVWEPDNRLDVDDTTDRGLLGLELHDLEGRLDNDEKKLNWAAYRLIDIAAVFSGGKKGEPIGLASQWLFDSHVGRDEQLSFIQAMVVLEILLGDKKVSDEIGLGQLMRNRCAYLIGSSQKDRTEVLRLFNEIYSVRSQIVHSGKHKLTLAEQSLFSRLRWMCRRVIAKEVELLRADTKSA